MGEKKKQVRNNSIDIFRLVAVFDCICYVNRNRNLLYEAEC